MVKKKKKDAMSEFFACLTHDVSLVCISTPGHSKQKAEPLQPGLFSLFIPRPTSWDKKVQPLQDRHSKLAGNAGKAIIRGMPLMPI